MKNGIEFLTIPEAKELEKLFLDKVKDQSWLHSLPRLGNESSDAYDWGHIIFNGTDGDSKRIASIYINSVKSEDAAIVSLIIGNNSFQFFNNFSLCKELIERFVIV